MTIFYPLSQDYNLAYYTTHVVCINFIRRSTLQIEFEQQIFETLFEKKP